MKTFGSNFQGMSDNDILKLKVKQPKRKEKHRNFLLPLAKVCSFDGMSHVMDVIFEKKRRAQVVNISARRSQP